MRVNFILYVSDQVRSRNFYSEILGLPPVLDVPGMTEFDLDGCTLGLMPENGIARIICPQMPHPEQGNGLPRCELYLKVADAQMAHERALRAGASEIEPVKNRDWGDAAGYLSDLDGHIIAFAQTV